MSELIGVVGAGTMGNGIAQVAARAGYDAPPAPDWRGTLRDGSAYDWESQRASHSSRPRDYAPPRQPPDWRG